LPEETIDAAINRAPDQWACPLYLVLANSFGEAVHVEDAHAARPMTVFW
jgi:hypothetical protein